MSRSWFRILETRNIFVVTIFETLSLIIIVNVWSVFVLSHSIILYASIQTPCSRDESPTKRKQSNCWTLGIRVEPPTSTILGANACKAANVKVSHSSSSSDSRSCFRYLTLFNQGFSRFLIVIQGFWRVLSGFPEYRCLLATVALWNMANNMTIWLWVKTQVNIPKTFKIDYFWRVIIPKQVLKVLTHMVFYVNFLFLMVFWRPKGLQKAPLWGSWYMFSRFRFNSSVRAAHRPGSSSSPNLPAPLQVVLRNRACDRKTPGRPLVVA